jgi:peptidoglycan/LPS O-acetylase OafA/YrhL
MEIKNYQNTNFITGLRGYAILMVAMIHFGGFGLRNLGTVGNNIVDCGKCGVFIFFVISGFAITNSFLNSSGYKEFLIKRFFRIAPMFYFMIIIWWVLGVQNSWIKLYDQDYSVYNLLMHFLFLFSFDYKTAFTITGVEWTLGIEMFWYVLFPFIILATNSKKRLAILIVSIILVNYLNKLAILAMYEDGFLAYHISPIRYLYVFLMGFGCYYIRKEKKIYDIKYLCEGLTILAVLLFVVLVCVGNGSLFNYSLITSILIISGHSKNKISKLLFENKPIIYLGTISYSFYLTHTLIIELLPKDMGVAFSFLQFFIAVLISVFTYSFVETAFNKFAKNKFTSKTRQHKHFYYPVSEYQDKNQPKQTIVAPTNL